MGTVCSTIVLASAVISGVAVAVISVGAGAVISGRSFDEAGNWGPEGVACEHTICPTCAGQFFAALN